MADTPALRNNMAQRSENKHAFNIFQHLPTISNCWLPALIRTFSNSNSNTTGPFALPATSSCASPNLRQKSQRNYRHNWPWLQVKHCYDSSWCSWNRHSACTGLLRYGYMASSLIGRMETYNCLEEQEHGSNPIKKKVAKPVDGVASTR